MSPQRLWKTIGSLQNNVFSSRQRMCWFRAVWKEALSRILDINGDDSKTADDMLDQCEELFKNLEVDMP